MSVVRTVHNRENPYVQLNKETLWNPKLSLKAVGLWARCMSRPSNWRFHVNELAKCMKEGRRAIFGAIDELIEAGYVVRAEFVFHGNGRFDGKEVEYIFFEFPPTPEELDKILCDLKEIYRRCGFSTFCKRTLLKKEEETKERSNTDKGRQRPKSEAEQAPPPQIASDAEREALPDDRGKEEPPSEIVEKFKSFPESIQLEAVRVYEEAKRRADEDINRIKASGGEIHRQRDYSMKVLRQKVESIHSSARKRKKKAKQRIKS